MDSGPTVKREAAVHRRRTAEQLRAMIPTSTDPEYLERMAREVEGPGNRSPESAAERDRLVGWARGQ